MITYVQCNKSRNRHIVISQDRSVSCLSACHDAKADPALNSTEEEQWGSGNVEFTGCGKKSSPLLVFANFSAVVPEFKVKFGTLV